MIVSDVILRVRRTFGDEAAVQVQDADIIRWINDAQVEIVRKNESALQKSTFSNLVANQGTYALPTDLLALRSVRYKFPDMLSYNNLKYKNMQEFDDSLDGWDGNAYTTGNPIYFTVDEGNVILFPVPNVAATNGLKIRYNQRPTDVASTSDALALPTLYHPIIVKYCLYQASLLDEDGEPAVMYRNDFNSDVQELQNNETSDPTATYSVITVLEADL